MIEENENNFSSETNSYYWLCYDGLKVIISMNSYNHLESEQERIEKKKNFTIDSKKCLCKHGGLNPILSREVKYTPGNVYTHMKK